MNSILKYLLILPILLSLIVAGFSQTKLAKAGPRDHTDALSQIYAEITSEEERAELAEENPDEIFLTGEEVFESALSEELAVTQTKELPFGDIVEKDKPNKTDNRIASSKSNRVKENLKKPIKKDLTKTRIAKTKRTIKSSAPKVVVPTQPVRKPTATKSNVVVNAPSKSKNLPSPTYVESPSKSKVVAPTIAAPTQPVSEPTFVESTMVVSIPNSSNNSSSPTYVELKVVRPVTTYIDSNIETITTATRKKSKKSISRSSSKTYVEYSAGAMPTFGSGKYQIQLGYFESAIEANQLAEQLRSKYYEPVTIAEDSSKRTVSYRVLLGDYEKFSDAQILFRTLRNNGAEATIMQY